MRPLVVTSRRKLVNSLKTQGYGNIFLDVSLKPIAIATIYQREFMISLKPISITTNAQITC